MENILQRVAERKIEEAIENGEFDNLPGKGKPINLDDDPLTPPHMRLAHKILKNAGVLPDWMQLEVEIEKARLECATTFAKLEKEYRRRRRKLTTPPAHGGDSHKPRQDFADWLVRQRDTHLRALKRVDSDITKLSLMAPSVPRAHIPFRIAEEMERFDTAFPPLPGVEGQAPTDAEARESTLRLSAQGLYENMKRIRDL